MSDESKEELPSPMYEVFCKQEFMEIKDGLSSIKKEIQRLNRKLFIDNGTESIQSKANRHDQKLKQISWVAGIIIAALLTTITVGSLAWAMRISQHLTENSQ